MKHKLLGLIAALLLLCLAVTEARASVTASGTVKYTRAWVGCATSPGNRADCSLNGSLLPYVGRIDLRNTTTGQIKQATTNTAGFYSVAISGGGNYELRTRNRDGDSTGVPSAKVALVSGPENAWTEYVTIASPATISVPGTTGTVTFNVNISTSSTAHNPANVYMAAVQQRAVWTTQYLGSVMLTGTTYKVRIAHDATTSRGGAFCFSAGDCVMSSHVNFTTRNIDTIWHETGHGMMELVQFLTFGDAITSAPISAYPCANAGSTASRSLEEGFAQAVLYLTKYPPNSIPANFSGGICNFCEYSATGAQPNPPACGVGTISRNSERVAKGFVELMDSNSVGADTGCNTESITIDPGDLLDVFTFFSYGSCQQYPGCAANCGMVESGVHETWCPSAPQSPNWPYTGSNALTRADEMSFLDVLGKLKGTFGFSGTELKKIWANTCWQPGDSPVQLP